MTPVAHKSAWEELDGRYRKDNMWEINQAFTVKRAGRKIQNLLNTLKNLWRHGINGPYTIRHHARLFYKLFWQTEINDLDLTVWGIGFKHDVFVLEKWANESDGETRLCCKSLLAPCEDVGYWIIPSNLDEQCHDRAYNWWRKEVVS